ncbi:MAG: AraC family transcriptional regulator [Nitrosomonadales bacterium]|nr:AraC family transcriptional regulator [Nitrosomonadales bacterium]
MIPLALLLIGFSLFSALTLALIHFRRENYQDQTIAKIMGLILMLALCGLQLAHFAWLYLDQAWVETTLYRMTLFAVAPTFYLFSQPLLRPQNESRIRWMQLWHMLPVVAAPWLPGAAALPAAFIVGAGYLLWLARSLFALRHERSNFHLELMLLGGVFAIAIGVSVLGLIQTALPEKLFFSLYAVSIGLAFLLVQLTLGLRPQLSTEVSEAAQESYASSTLTNVDCDAALSGLNSLMQSEHIYEDAELSLPGLAAKLGISPHQLSELMNTRLGKGFSRYLREQRIDAAKAMLRDEPSASVLSVGLSVGFSAQSNFYEAFREIEGMTPGQYRKLHPRNKTPR